MLRRVNLIILLGLIIVLVLSFGVSASAEPGNGGDEETSLAQGELLQPQDELAQMRQAAVEAEANYNNARFELEQLNQDIVETVLKQADAEENLKKSQANLQKQAVAVYKAGPLYLLDFLLGAESFSDFADRFWFSIKALLGMADSVESWKNESNELEQIQVELRNSVDEREHELAETEALQEEANAQRAALEETLNEDQNLQQAIEDQHELGQQSLEDLAQEDPILPLLIPEDETAGAPIEEPGIDTMQAEEGPIVPEASPVPEIPVEDQEEIRNASLDTQQAAREAAEQEAAARRAAEEAANLATTSMLPPAGAADEKAATPLNSGAPNNATPLAGGTNNTPSPADANKTAAPLNSANNTAPLTDSVNNPVVDAAREAAAKQAAADQAATDAANQAAKLGNAMQQAQPAAGLSTNPTTLGQPKATAPAGQTGAQAAPAGSATGGSAVGIGMGLVGMPYAWGTEGPDTFSCTGLVRYILGSLGLPKPSWDHMAWLSEYPTVAEPQPGHLVVYPDGGAMYIGGGNVLMANEVDGVVGVYPMNAIGTPVGFANPYP
jgi:peptidoglycan hydrolase CwlO-like protein/cell wall-associated NlpC family hydrolase